MCRPPALIATNRVVGIDTGVEITSGVAVGIDVVVGRALEVPSGRDVGIDTGVEITSGVAVGIDVVVGRALGVPSGCSEELHANSDVIPSKHTKPIPKIVARAFETFINAGDSIPCKATIASTLTDLPPRSYLTSVLSSYSPLHGPVSGITLLTTRAGKQVQKSPCSTNRVSVPKVPGLATLAISFQLEAGSSSPAPHPSWL